MSERNKLIGFLLAVFNVLAGVLMFFYILLSTPKHEFIPAIVVLLTFCMSGFMFSTLFYSIAEALDRLKSIDENTKKQTQNEEETTA